MKLKAIALVLIASASSVFGASTLNLRNFSSASAGLPIVDAAGDALAVGTFFANAGYFSTTLDFATATFEDIRTSFVGIDNTPVAAGTRSGLFTGQTFNGTLSSDLIGKNAYIVVGNNANLAEATLFAIFDAKTTFTGPDSFGNSNQTLDALAVDNIVYGLLTPVRTQPSGLNNAAFVNGVQLVAVPEPSALLLGAVGALGLLRRRRN